MSMIAEILVEFLDRVRLFEIAVNPMLEEVDERLGMALGVHAHEGAELQEAGVTRRPRPTNFHGTVPIRLSRNHAYGFSLASWLTLLGAIRTSIGPAIKVRLAGSTLAPSIAMHRGRGERRDGRLADRDDMAILPDMADEIDQVPGVVLQPEAAGVERDVARIDPVGEIDLMVAQHRPERAAQQRGEMAGHGGHQQHLRIVGAALLRKMQQLAERRAHRAVLRRRAGSPRTSTLSTP